MTMEMRGNKEFDWERNPNVSSTEEEASKSRALNDENAVVGVDERGRNESISFVDEKMDVDSDSNIPPGFDGGLKCGEFEVSAGENSGAAESAVQEHRELSGAEGGVEAGVLGGDGDRVVDSGSSGDVPNYSIIKVPLSKYFKGEINPLLDISNKDDEVPNGLRKYMGIAEPDDPFWLRNNGPPLTTFKISFDISVADSAEGGKLKVGHGFEMGDMVWGKVKSHPWWPGHIFNEAFASSAVRKTKKDGHLLVSFFGDSSYGWFDPAELLPYEPHFAEKSRQTNSRNFVKAVEESVAEASRRSALGLSCRCRNRYNFWPTNYRGYWSVDVFDYEPYGIYSVSQIKKARDSFQTGATLSFVKQLALAPKNAESRSIDFIENRAIALAYRKAIFEEFDDTYAQAFGQEPERPVLLPPTSLFREPRYQKKRASLSGPLVIAEALGGQKSSTKAAKFREHARRDRYLFKRRDVPQDSRTAQTGRRPGSSSSSAHDNRPSESAAEDYVFRRRDLAVSVNDGQVLTPAGDEGAASSVGAERDAASGALSRTDGSEMSGKGLLAGAIHVSQHHAPGVSTSRGEHDGLGHTAFPGGGAGKKVKAARPHGGKLNYEQSDLVEKKKRRKMDAEMSSSHPQKRPMTGSSGASVGKLSGKSIQIATQSNVDSQLGHQKKDVEGIPCVSEHVGQMPLDGTEKSEVELPQLLGDLQALALSPFHGSQRNRPAILRQVFLRFRSLVFQKSSAASPSAVPECRSITASPPVASESQEVRVIKSPPISGTQVIGASGESVRSMAPSKLPKPLGSRVDDPAKAGRKRVPSERQEESAAKRVKKIADAKSSSAEKRTVQKIPEMQHADGRGKATAPPPAVQAPPAVPVPARAAKAEPLKRMEPPQRLEEPTYLMMKYPPGSSLPSSTELRARFIRFGPMDTSGNRIFYRTNTCRVMFLHKEDAQKAYDFCVGNKSIYPNVRFSLKPVPVQDPLDVSQSSRGEEMSNEHLRAQPLPATEQRTIAPQLLHQPHPQLKSILKKPAGDETELGVRGPRVRFDMGLEFRGSGVHSMDHRKSSTFQGSGPSTVVMDVASNSQQLISQHPLPPLPPPHLLSPPPPPPQTSRAPYNQQHNEVGPRVNATDAPPDQAPNIDIRQQMLVLLARCHDIVANLVSAHGFPPYHPL
ncbi:hypothetical protein Ancab_024187 [Ancistrocladus abbreviatus]